MKYLILGRNIKAYRLANKLIFAYKVLLLYPKLIQLKVIWIVLKCLKSLFFCWKLWFRMDIGYKHSISKILKSQLLHRISLVKRENIRKVNLFINSWNSQHKIYLIGLLPVFSVFNKCLKIKFELITLTYRING